MQKTVVETHQCYIPQASQNADEEWKEHQGKKGIIEIYKDNTVKFAFEDGTECTKHIAWMRSFHDVKRM